jgi:hypothetical protein
MGYQKKKENNLTLNSMNKTTLVLLVAAAAGVVGYFAGKNNMFNTANQIIRSNTAGSSTVKQAEVK